LRSTEQKPSVNRQLPGRDSEGGEKMNFGTIVRIALISAVLIALPLVASAKTKPAGPGDCHNDPGGCIHRMQVQLKQIKVYLVAHVKPGDPVEFNPQPDPPGDPDPWYRKANEGYAALTQEVADLAGNQTEVKLTRSTPQRREAFGTAVRDAQTQLTRLGQRLNKREANTAFGLLNGAVGRISQMVAH
jgi:hypothetical protein